MNKLAISEPFQNVALALPPLENERQVIDNAFLLHNAIKSWFTQNNFQEANAALDLLMSKKVARTITGEITELKMRRNGITPDFIHELHQVLSITADYQAGLITREQLQPAIVTALMHDIGEDFNVLPNTALNLLSQQIKNPSPESIKEHIRRMEILTFDRAYSAEQVLEEISVHKSRPIQEQDLKLLQEKIEEESTCLEGLGFQPIQFIAEPNDKGKYKFSRYIFNDIIDWNLYTKAFSDDEYTAYIKPKDRNDGLGTRIGKNFNLDSYNNYLSQTYQSFSINNIGKKAADKYPNMREAILASDHMMFVLHRIGRAYIQHHPDRNLTGGKGYNIETLPDIDFQGRVPAALTGYQHMETGTNPLYIILDRIKNKPEDHGTALHKILVESIEQDIKITSSELTKTPHAQFVQSLKL